MSKNRPTHNLCVGELQPATPDRDKKMLWRQVGVGWLDKDSGKVTISLEAYVVLDGEKIRERGDKLMLFPKNKER